MPKDRKKTYSDRQSDAARAKKKQPKDKALREDVDQSAAGSSAKPLKRD